jgi:dsRNA-specific ribonuclease
MIENSFMKKQQNQLSSHIGYDFKDKFLLKLALTHRSLGSSNNERLEFWVILFLIL